MTFLDITATPAKRKISGLNKRPDGSEFVRLDCESGYVDGIFKRVTGSDALIVMFPSAMPASALTEKRFPHLPRWQWVDEIPANVWCFEEVIARRYNIAGGWFHERDHFYADSIAEIIQEIASELCISSDRITMMGSSLGGFGALMAAPKIAGSKVVADISQTNLISYHVRRAIEDFCEKIYHTRDVDAVNAANPDRFSVIERFRKVGHVPDMTILHDISDEPNGHQQIYPFFTELANLQSTEGHSFKFEGMLRNAGRGHIALHKFAMLPILYDIAEIKV